MVLRATQSWLSPRDWLLHPEALRHLATLYAEGQGVPQDFTQAAEWYRRAAEQGLADAQYNLASIYANGDGINTDFAAAYLWFTLAAGQGDADAERGLEVIGRRMSPAELDEGQRLVRNFRAIN